MVQRCRDPPPPPPPNNKKSPPSPGPPPHLPLPPEVPCWIAPPAPPSKMVITIPFRALHRSLAPKSIARADFSSAPTDTEHRMTPVDTNHDHLLKKIKPNKLLAQTCSTQGQSSLRADMLPTVTLGIPACMKLFSVIVLSIIVIILICVGREGRGLRDCARECQKNTDSHEDDERDEHHSHDCLLE